MFITNSEDWLALYSTIFASHISNPHLCYVNGIVWFYDKMYDVLFEYS